MQTKFEYLRSHPVFEWSIVAVIIFSALMVGAKTYNLPPLVYQVISVLDWVITLIFLFEISVRFFGEKVKKAI